MKITEQQHPFYKPLWRRLLIIGFVAAWFAYELVFTEEPLWLAISGGILAYAVWAFLLSWPREPTS